MGRPKKCVICGKPIIDEEGIPYKNRYAHSDCFQSAIKLIAVDKKDRLEEKNKQSKEKTKQSKSKAELKDGLSEEEYAEKTKYYSYIRSLLELNNNDKLDAKYYVISNRMIEEYSFTWKGMYLTLCYLKEILQKEVKDNYIGLIPYYYETALSFFDKVKKIEEDNKQINTAEMYSKKTIYIEPRKRVTKLLDVEDIG